MHGTHHEFLNNKRRNIEQINVREKEQSDTGNIKHRTQNEDKKKNQKKIQINTGMIPVALALRTQCFNILQI